MCGHCRLCGAQSGPLYINPLELGPFANPAGLALGELAPLAIEEITPYGRHPRRHSPCGDIGRRCAHDSFPIRTVREVSTNRASCHRRSAQHAPRYQAPFPLPKHAHHLPHVLVVRVVVPVVVVPVFVVSSELVCVLQRARRVLSLLLPIPEFTVRVGLRGVVDGRHQMALHAPFTWR